MRISKRTIIQMVATSLVVFSLLPFVSACKATAPAPSPTAPYVAPTSTPTTVPVKPIILIASCPWVGPPSKYGLQYGHWLDGVEKATGGRVIFERYWAGTLAAAGEELMMTAKGAIDINLCGPLYNAGKFPLMGQPHFYFPFASRDVKLSLELFRRLIKEFPEWQAEWKPYNQMLLGGFVTVGHELTSVPPIKTVADMKGKKIGVIGTAFPKWVAAVGAVPVTSAMGDRYQMLERKVIDGEYLPVDSVISWKHQEIEKYYTETGIKGASFDLQITVNLDAWNRLPADIQQIMLNVTKETEEWWVGYQPQNEQECLDIMKKAGMEFYSFSNEDRAKWAEVCPDVAAEWAKELDEKAYPGTKLGTRFVKRFIEISEELGYKWPRRWGQQ